MNWVEGDHNLGFERAQCYDHNVIKNHRGKISVTLTEYVNLKRRLLYKTRDTSGNHPEINLDVK